MKKLTPLFLSFLFLLVASAPASAADRDKDGLSDKRERKIGTSPRKADTDRDALRDGREVRRTRTNPLRADTDRDGVRDGREVRDGFDPLDPDSDDDGAKDIFERKGRIEAITYTEGDPLVTVRTPRKTIFQVRVDERTFLEGLDRDGDSLLTLLDFQIGDRVEINLDPDNPRRAQTLELHLDDEEEDNEWKGQITAITGNEVSVRNRGGVTRSFIVDIDTFLRAPDRNADGVPSLNDLLVGDLVEVHLDENGEKALSLEVRWNDDYDPDDPGYEDGNDPGHEEEDKAEGWLLPGFTESSLTIVRRGHEQTITINESTKFYGLDRNEDGFNNFGDLLPGDKIEARLRGNLATDIEYKRPEDDHYVGGEEPEIKGFIASKDPFILQTLQGSVTLFPGSETEYEVPDFNLDSEENFDDFQIGMFVEARFRASDRVLLELEAKQPPRPN